MKVQLSFHRKLPHTLLNPSHAGVAILLNIPTRIPVESIRDTINNYLEQDMEVTVIMEKLDVWSYFPPYSSVQFSDQISKLKQ
jgi:hypothetical protein